MKKCKREMLKEYHCEICDKIIYPSYRLQDERFYGLINLYNHINRHHIDYIKNIYINVCDKCHKELHTGKLKNHKYGVNNLIGFTGYPGSGGHLIEPKRVWEILKNKKEKKI